MRRPNHIINYDFDHNTFYRVNHEGQHRKTHFNGEPVNHFKPNITGQNYLIRRTTDLAQPQSLATERTAHDFHTLDYSPRSQTKITDVPTGRTTFFSNKRSSRIFSEKRRSDLKMDIDDDVSLEKSEQKQKQDILNQTLSSYTKLLKQKFNTNHSPKNSEIAGSQKPFKPYETLCTTVNSFKLRQPVWQSQDEMKAPRTVLQRKLESNRSKKRKTSKERQLYLAFHPSNVKDKEQKRDEVQKERKVNLKILENLFIRQNNRGTRRIYHSTA